MDELSNNISNTGNQTAPEGYSIEEILEQALETKEVIADFRKVMLRYLIRNKIREPDWLNNDEVKKVLKISSRTLRRYRQQKLIRYIIVSGLCKYRYTDVLSLLMDKRNEQDHY